MPMSKRQKRPSKQDLPPKSGRTEYTRTERLRHAKSASNKLPGSFLKYDQLHRDEGYGPIQSASQMTVNQLPLVPATSLSKHSTALGPSGIVVSDTSAENPEEMSIPVRVDAEGRRLGPQDTLICDIEGNFVFERTPTDTSAPSVTPQPEPSLDLHGSSWSRSESTETVRTDGAVTYTPSVLEFAKQLEGQLSYEEYNNDES